MKLSFSSRAALFSILAFLFLPACSRAALPGETAAVETVQACDLRAYRSKAEPLMYEFAAITSRLSLYETASRLETVESLNTLLTKIEDVPCKDDYPFKHETLELTVQHTIDAINFTGDGDPVSADQSFDKALMNINEFKDWNFDVP